MAGKFSAEEGASSASTCSSCDAGKPPSKHHLLPSRDRSPPPPLSLPLIWRETHVQVHRVGSVFALCVRAGVRSKMAQGGWQASSLPRRALPPLQRARRAMQASSPQNTTYSLPATDVHLPPPLSLQLIWRQTHVQVYLAHLAHTWVPWVPSRYSGSYKSECSPCCMRV